MTVDGLRFPTALHREAAELVRDRFISEWSVDTVLVVNSCARGHATPDSDLDLAVLVDVGATSQTMQDLEAAWLSFKTGQPLMREFQESGRFTHLHLDFFDGRFVPPVWDEGGGPDAFEIEIGNRIAHAAPFHEPGPGFRDLQARWLPYYDEDLRGSRLAIVRDACLYDLEHVPFLVERGLHIHAFDRLYKAFQEFLQALFISQRIYPVAYNKWIREQVEGWLELGDLYRELPSILSVANLESPELVEHATRLRTLLDLRLSG